MSPKTAISLAGALVMASLSAPAYAYLDPATGSIILQAVIGGVAGATLLFRTQLYRLKMLFSRARKESDGE